MAQLARSEVRWANINRLSASFPGSFLSCLETECALKCFHSITSFPCTCKPLIHSILFHFPLCSDGHVQFCFRPSIKLAHAPLRFGRHHPHDTFFCIPRFFWKETRWARKKNDLMHASIDRCSLRVGLRKVLFHVVLVSGTQKRYPPKPDTHAPMSASSMDI